MVAWLYAGDAGRIAPRARALLDGGEPRVSPFVELELAFLFEIGRITEPPAAPLAALRRAVGLEVADASASELASTATGLSWTRDPFDRLIAAHAIAAGTTLLTADRTILRHLPLAAWD